MRGSTAGLPDTFQGSGTTYYTLITVMDLLFAAIVVGPCVVGYWRSVWNLMDFYVLPENRLYSAAISTVIGLGGHLVFILLQKVLERNFHPDKNRILFYIVSRSYTMCFSFIGVNSWRGPWELLTIQTQEDFKSLMVATVIGLVALIAMRAVRNVSAPPCLITNDSPDGYFEMLTMFRVSSVTEQLPLFLLDCLFTVFVVNVLVVFVWRGMWHMLDVFILPNDYTASHHASLILGYSILAAVFLLQPLVRSICNKLSGAAKLLFADSFVIFALIGTVNVWRGVWGCLDIYILPDNLALSSWITLVVSSLLLILLNCANSIAPRGVFIDAEEPDGKCVVLPCYYFRLMFQAEKIKKINNKRMQLANKLMKQGNSNADNHAAISVSTISTIVEEKENYNSQVII